MSGGSATGRATSVERSLRPGKSVRAKRKASGTPIAADSATVATEIQRLAQRACHSAGRRANSATWASVQCGAPSASPSVSTSG